MRISLAWCRYLRYAAHFVLGHINILLLLKLPSFGTVMHNASVLDHAQRLRVQNSIIQYLNEILV